MAFSIYWSETKKVTDGQRDGLNFEGGGGDKNTQIILPDTSQLYFVYESSFVHYCFESVLPIYKNAFSLCIFKFEKKHENKNKHFFPVFSPLYWIHKPDK